MFSSSSFSSKDNVVFQQSKYIWNGAKALYLRLQIADLLVLPVEDIAPHRVPGNTVGKANRLRCREHLLGNKQLRCLCVITPNLIHTKRDSFVLVGVLAFDHQHWNAIDEKHHIFPSAIVAIVKGELFGDFKDVPSRIIVVDQDQVALAILLMVEELAPVAEVLDEFPVAVDIRVEMAKLAE